VVSYRNVVSGGTVEISFGAPRFDAEVVVAEVGDVETIRGVVVDETGRGQRNRPGLRNPAGCAGCRVTAAALRALLPCGEAVRVQAAAAGAVGALPGGL
jgi:hypothetical protein